MLGPHGRMEVGGRTSGITDRVERKDDDKEPMNFYANTNKFWKEVLHQFEPTNVIELTTLDPTVAYECVQAGIHFTGLVFTKHHRVVLQKSIADTYKRQLYEESSEVWNIFQSSVHVSFTFFELRHEIVCFCSS